MNEAEKAAALEEASKPEVLEPGSQCKTRAATLRPSHLVKADRRAKNKVARKSRKANKIYAGHKVPKPVKKGGNGHQSARPNRNQSTKDKK